MSYVTTMNPVVSNSIEHVNNVASCQPRIQISAGLGRAPWILWSLGHREKPYPLSCTFSLHQNCGVQLKAHRRTLICFGCVRRLRASCEQRAELPNRIQIAGFNNCLDAGDCSELVIAIAPASRFLARPHSRQEVADFTIHELGLPGEFRRGFEQTISHPAGLLNRFGDN